jgi:cob(I)alamin adenosyltransferase
MKIDKIYTKTGDKGKTSLVDGTRVSKSNIVLNAVGTIDELNSFIGLIKEFVDEEVGQDSVIRLQRIQQDLFDIGCILATPTSRRVGMEFNGDRVERLENEIDAFTKSVSPLRSFILPGGGKCGAFAHTARTVCRRAERIMVEDLNYSTEELMQYINRLSDWLFAFARWISLAEGEQETVWSKDVLV